MKICCDDGQYLKHQFLNIIIIEVAKRNLGQVKLEAKGLLGLFTSILSRSSHYVCVLFPITASVFLLPSLLSPMVSICQVPLVSSVMVHVPRWMPISGLSRLCIALSCSLWFHHPFQPPFLPCSSLLMSLQGWHPDLIKLLNKTKFLR